MHLTCLWTDSHGNIFSKTKCSHHNRNQNWHKMSASLGHCSPIRKMRVLITSIFNQNQRKRCTKNEKLVSYLMALQLKDMTEWLADSCTDFALVSGVVGHPLNEVAWQKLYFFHYGTYSSAEHGVYLLGDLYMSLGDVTSIPCEIESRAVISSNFIGVGHNFCNVGRLPLK
jgi:hypothetical protein